MPIAKAAFDRGVRLADQERLGQARRAYQAAVSTGDTEYGPRAAIALAELLRRTGELAGARVAYQIAIDSGHPDMAPAAADALGMMLAANRDDPRALDAAIAAFRHAAESGHPSYARGSGWTLGMLLGLRGDLAGARAAFRLSALASPAATAHATMIRYAAILAGEFGDFEGATAFLHETIGTGDLVHARRARTELDMIEAAHGDLDAYRRATDATWAAGASADGGATAEALPDA